MAENVVVVGNLGTEFDIGTLEANKIRVKIDGTLVKNGDGTIGVNGGSLTVVSADTGNLIAAGGDGGAFINQAAFEAAETAWSGSDAGGFLTVSPAGTNGHTVSYGFDFTNAAFVEACQDAIGAAALAGAGITYDDVADSISSSLGNITFGDGLNFAGNTATVLPNPASVLPVVVAAAGVSVTQTVSTDLGNLASLGADNRLNVPPAAVQALATEQINDAFGVAIFKAFPN